MTLKMCNECGCAISINVCNRCGHSNIFKKRIARICRSEHDMKRQFDYRLSTALGAKAENHHIIIDDNCEVVFMHKKNWKDEIRGRFFDEFYIERSLTISKQDALSMSLVLQ